MHAIEREVRILRMYCLLTVPVLVLLVFAGFVQKPRFGEIAVQRINVVEPDGKTRLVISNKTRAPDAVLGGKTFKRQGGNSAGLIFYNQEGDEDGGLVFSGAARNGRYEAGGALLFDQYHQDQVVGIQYRDDNGSRSAGFQVWDRSDIPAAETLEREQAIARMPDGPEKIAARERLRARDPARHRRGEPDPLSRRLLHRHLARQPHAEPGASRQRRTGIVTAQRLAAHHDRR